MRERSGTGSETVPQPCPRPWPFGLKSTRLHDRRRVITGCDDQRHAQRELITGLMHRLLILNLHDHGFFRSDIGDRVGKDVRPLLFHQARLLAGRLRLLVRGARLRPLLDLADDDALADHHPQRVDGAAVGQRVHIDGLDPAIGRVVKNLADAGARGWTADREIHVGPEKRSLDVAILAALEQERTRAHLGGSDELRHQRGAADFSPSASAEGLRPQNAASATKRVGRNSRLSAVPPRASQGSNDRR